MRQATLATAGFERYAKRTRRAAFLDEMERIVPWSALCAQIEPFYPKPGNGRPPIGVVERMLRIHFLQQFSRSRTSRPVRRPGSTLTCRVRSVVPRSELATGEPSRAGCSAQPTSWCCRARRSPARMVWSRSPPRPRSPCSPFRDPDPFRELTFADPLAARRAIADEIRLPLAKLSDEDLAFVDALLARTLARPEMLAAVREHFPPGTRRKL